MYKYLSIVCIVAIGLIGYSRGQTSHADCGLVNNTRDNIFSALILPLSIADLLPPSAQERVTKNLRSYCCEQKHIQNIDTTKVCKDQDLPGGEYYPQSPFLIDHVIDVMFRRLDGNPSLIYNDVELHPLGEAWRNLVNTFVTDPDGVIPMNTINAINSYRNPNVDNTSSKQSLFYLYSIVCTSAFDAYKMIGSTSPGATQTTAVSGGSRNACTELTYDRIQQELLYARSLVDILSNRALEQYMDQYLQQYFSTNRLMNLQGTLSTLVGAFTTVNRLVVEGTRQCSL